MPLACFFRRLAENFVPHSSFPDAKKFEERESGGPPDSARGPRALPGVPGGTLNRYLAARRTEREERFEPMGPAFSQSHSLQFQSAGRRPERAGRPFDPILKHVLRLALSATLLVAPMGAPPLSAAPASPSNAAPVEIVLVEAETVTAAAVSEWKKEGFKAVAVVLDERTGEAG